MWWGVKSVLTLSAFHCLFSTFQSVSMAAKIFFSKYLSYWLHLMGFSIKLSSIFGFFLTPVANYLKILVSNLSVLWVWLPLCDMMKRNSYLMKNSWNNCVWPHDLSISRNWTHENIDKKKHTAVWISFLYCKITSLEYSTFQTNWYNLLNMG